jgi:hypothetical protein
LAGISSVTLPSTLPAGVLWPPSAGGGRVAEPTRGFFELCKGNRIKAMHDIYILLARPPSQSRPSVSCGQHTSR